jgi:hypothetical protein
MMGALGWIRGPSTPSAGESCPRRRRDRSQRDATGDSSPVILEVVSQSTGGCGRPPRPMASSRTLHGIHRFPSEIRSSPSTPGARPRLPVICETTSTHRGEVPSILDHPKWRTNSASRRASRTAGVLCATHSSCPGAAACGALLLAAPAEATVASARPTSSSDRALVRSIASTNSTVLGRGDGRVGLVR